MNNYVVAAGAQGGRRTFNLRILRSLQLRYRDGAALNITAPFNDTALSHETSLTGRKRGVVVAER